MTSRERQAKIQELGELIQITLPEIKQAKESDAQFEEIKKLYLHLKDLSGQLTEVLDQVDYSAK